MLGSHQSNSLRRAATVRRGDRCRTLDIGYGEAPDNAVDGRVKRIDFEEAKRWISHCASSHPKCRAPSRSALIDLKVIDCRYREVVSRPQGHVYVALSYVWGDSGPEDTQQGSKLSKELPRTIDDSIEATLKLGYWYLWIDRYCIDQNDSVAQQHQIHQMGAIYHEAQVTIIAAAGTDPTYGLSGLTQNFKKSCSCTVSDFVRLLHTKGSAVQSIKDSVWYTRGWTYQEGFLSRRRMYLTDAGVLYVCDEDRHSASLSKISASLRNTSARPSFHDDEQMMREYTRRQLTHDYDALNAILGALETQSDRHIWGVNISQGTFGTYVFLHWRHLFPVRRRKGFPSWSPLGWCGQVEYSKSAPGLSYLCRLEAWRDKTYKPLPRKPSKLAVEGYPNLTVEENSKRLRLTTLIVTLEFIHIEGTHRDGVYAKVPYSPTLDIFVLPYWDIDCVSELGLEGGSIKLPCIVAMGEGSPLRFPKFENEMQILILRVHDRYYERIGCLSVDEDSERMFSGDEQGHELMHWLHSPEHGDGRYWLRDGVRTTFLLG